MVSRPNATSCPVAASNAADEAMLIGGAEVGRASVHVGAGVLACAMPDGDIATS
jgi:hypothetical protein